MNGVSRLHGEVSRTIFKLFFPRWAQAEIPISSITNGVHLPSWHSAHIDPFWKRVPLGPAGTGEDQWEPQIPDDDGDLWRARGLARNQLVEYVRRRLVLQVKQKGRSEQVIGAAGHVLDPDTLTLGLARRFAEYKRPDLLLRDPERLYRLLSNSARPVQLIVAGKAHPNDQYGKDLVKNFARYAAQHRYQHIVFVEDYDIELARYLVAGVDAWINTPRRPWEACGTSGMKILVNGGLNLSTLDGWWARAYEEGTGWALGDGETHGPEHDAEDAEQLYSILEHEIIPCFYQRTQSGIPERWMRHIRASMTRLTAQFSSARMLREYVELAYSPAALHYDNRKSISSAQELVDWNKRINSGWSHLRFGRIQTNTLETGRQFTVEAFLGDIHTDDIEVQLYAEPHTGSEKPEVLRMTNCGPILGSTNGFLYTGETNLDRSEADYTVRIIPSHLHVAIPLEQQQILWQK